MYNLSFSFKPYFIDCKYKKNKNLKLNNIIFFEEIIKSIKMKILSLQNQ